MRKFQVKKVFCTGRYGINGGIIYKLITTTGATQIELPRHLTNEYVNQICSACNSMDELNLLAISSKTIWKLFYEKVKMAFSIRKMS